MINLFEYQNKEPYTGSLNELELFLDDLWRNRETFSFFSDSEKDIESTQKFIQLLNRTGEIRSNKYVGVIYHKGERINLLPKIFYKPNQDYSELEVSQINNHIIWWLSYCRKIRFPNYHTSISSTKSDFLEILIYLFSKYTRTTISNTIFQRYEEKSEEVINIKGRLNTADYINQGIATGRWHKIHCTYESFTINNRMNQIIKCVSRLLLPVTKDHQSKRFLKDIIYILDEVDDIYANAEMCKGLTFNPMMQDYSVIRDYCSLFLSNSVSRYDKNELDLFAFFLPMEYVFEDFIYGFISKELPEVNAKSQSSNISLDESGVFSLKPDLLLSISGDKIIADTKYKMIYIDENDPKKGISQTDLYQMLAYAVRYQITRIILLYPNTVNCYRKSKTNFSIVDEIAGGTRITVEAYQVPFIGLDYETKNDEQRAESINKLFDNTKSELTQRLREIL